MLSVSRMTDYSVVVLSCFVKGQLKKILKASLISDKTGIPLPTVSKVLKVLAKGNVIKSHRGVDGGYSLERLPFEISMEEIVLAVDGPLKLTSCIRQVDNCCVSHKCGTVGGCPMRTNWDKVNTKVAKVFQSISLDEFLK